MSNCAATTVGFVPLTDAGDSPHDGIPLGLYLGDPSAHLATGLQIATAIRPRNSTGAPKNNGSIGFVSIGMSNTRHEFAAFLAQGPAPNPKVVFVNGAQQGKAAQAWADPSDGCWARLDVVIGNAGLTNAQIQIAWVKLCHVEPIGVWPEATETFQAELETTVRLLATRFPNLRIAYLSSRVYGGYAGSNPGNPEPYAYDGGFAVRGLISKQIDGLLPFSGAERVAPLILWGPYLWADGLTPRSDGLIWECADFEDDGLHPSESGKVKVAGLLRTFLTTDSTAVPWFVGAP